VTPSLDVLEAITEQRALAIVRLGTRDEAVAACRILAAAGLRAVEVSLAQAEATAAIAEAADELAGVAFVGAGTIRTIADATAAVAAGAQFLVGPGLDEAVAAWASERDLLYVPGALTPTEVEAAARWSRLVKLFPAGRFGPGYVRDLRAPFPDVPLVPTGGVDLDNARPFLDAGAAAVALGSSLVNARTVSAPDELAATTRRLLQLIAPATPTTRRP
jgi:2-dehydro-3-deoxyphosphogluconate aldolase / (4S)-4-hydroxy-2-oxoglutarate aldolase